jgi:hypothetical protein
MDWQNIMNLGATVVVGVISWFVKSTKDEQKETRHELQNFRLEVAKEYVTHTDLSDIKQTLFRIETKLDAKADK